MAFTSYSTINSGKSLRCISLCLPNRCALPLQSRSLLILSSSLIPKIANPLRVSNFIRSISLVNRGYRMITKILVQILRVHLLDNFGPISLVNTGHRMITKIPVQRLRVHLLDMISPSQNSFNKGRGFETKFFIVYEILHSIKKIKRKRGLFTLKLDLEKAYDRLVWPFIECCLNKFNFSTFSIKLIMNCVASSKTSIQVNGYRTPDFHPSSGIRQGDTLSPYIFIICLEYLFREIHEVCSSKTWNPFRIRGGSTKFLTSFLRKTFCFWGIKPFYP